VGLKKVSRCRGGALGLALLLGAAAPVVAQETRPELQQREHVVRRGDTLWDLARVYLGNPFAWPLIHEANRQTVANPHRIYPEERLLIPPVLPQGAVAPADAVGVALPVFEGPPGRTRFYAAATTAAEAAPTILIEEAPSPAIQPHEFYTASWIANAAALPVMGRLLRVVDPAAPGGRLSATVLPESRVYITHAGANRAVVGGSYLLAREGRTMPGWGRVIVPVAVVTVAAVDRDVATAAVTRQFGVASPGDLMLPLDAFPVRPGALPQPAAAAVTGQLVGFLEEQAIYGPLAEGYVNLGRAQGVQVGDELLAYLPERPAPEEPGVQLPPEAVAHLRVVRVEEQSATVRVVELVHAAVAAGMPVVVVRQLR
jgi:hypothetical protein